MAGGPLCQYSASLLVSVVPVKFSLSVICSVAHAAVQSLHPRVANPDLGETEQSWPGLEQSLWEREGRARGLVEHASPRSSSICTSAASPCPQEQPSSVSLLPCSLKRLHKLAELLPPLKTYSLEPTVTTMQKSELLLALQAVLDPCTTLGQTARVAQPPPLRRASGLALPWSCMGTSGRRAEQPLGLAPLGHPDECRGQLWAEMSHALSKPCLSVVRRWEPSLGHGVAAPLLAA